MIRFDNGGVLVQSVSELPRLEGGRLYLDFETTSGNPKIKSTNPHRDCKICGIGITNDRTTEAFYVPIRHNDPYRHYNLPVESVKEWLKDTFARHKFWVNQNVKYDMHALCNDLGIVFDGDVICVINALAKLYDSDRVYKGGYGLDVLSEQLLKKDIRKYEHRLSDYLVDTLDYGDIHPEVLGEYGCQDVFSVKELDEFFAANLPTEVHGVRDTEIKVTKCLFEMEQHGVRVAPIDIITTKIEVQMELLQNSVVFKELCGRYINSKSPEDMYDVVCNIFGMPVISYTNEDDDSLKSNPSFSTPTLREYYNYQAEDNFYKFLKLAIRDRELKTFFSLFLDTYEREHIDGILHPDFNQNVRTGRLSCSRPNLQQLSKLAKALILPHAEGESIIRFDYSQIEYRTIVHYIRDMQAIIAFRKDPDTDYHAHVAEQMRRSLGIASFSRKPAKQLNFQNAYGGGVKKQIQALSGLKEIVSYVESELKSNPRFLALPQEQQTEILKSRVAMLAEKTHKTYHQQVPTLKPTAKAAENACKARGYVFNLFGRRRHIPPEFAHIAFNALNQSTAADVLKWKMVELREALKGTPIKMLIQVHDELVFSGPKEIVEDPRCARDIAAILEEPIEHIKLAVPLRTSGGISDKNWQEASDEDKNGFKVSIEDVKKGERFQWI